MMPSAPHPVVHLELHTTNLGRASALLSRLCNWCTEPIASEWGSYHGLELGRSLGGGIVECGTERSLWLPYVEVDDVGHATRRARRLGASVLLTPREGPAGWRSVVSVPEGAQVALWQRKEAR